MAYGDFRDLNRRTFADEVLCYKAFDIAKNLKHDGYHCGFFSMVYNFFHKKTSSSSIKSENISHKELAKELPEPIVKKVNNKRNVDSPILDHFWGTDLVVIQLISKFNKGFGFLLCFFNINSKYAWIIPLKDKI